MKRKKETNLIEVEWEIWMPNHKMETIAFIYVYI